MSEDKNTPEFVSGSRRFHPQEITFEDEMMIMGNRLNFYIPICFEPVEIFGEKMRMDDGDGFINVYANYDLDKGCVCDTLEIVKVVYDEKESDYCYLLSDEEKAIIQKKMEQYHYANDTLQTIRKEYLAEKSSVLAQLDSAQSKVAPVSSRKSYAPEL